MRPSLNIGKTLAEAALRYPEKIALRQGDEAWTWKALNENADAFAAGLRAMGCQRGDFVFVMTPNNRASYETIYATAKIAVADVPLNFRATPNELVEFAQICKPKVFVVHDDLVDRAEAACAAVPEIGHVVVIGTVPGEKRAAGWRSYDEVIAEHLGVVVPAAAVEHDEILRVGFSGGSTGKPKAVINTFGQAAYTIVNRHCDVMPGVTPDHTFLAIGPLSHGSSTVVWINTARAAGTVMLSSPRFDERECWDLIEKHRITSLFLVPTMLMRLINHPSAEGRDLSSLKHVVYAGAPITRADQKLAIKTFGSALIQYYGSGETMGHGTVLRPEMHSLRDDDPLAPPGSVGLPRTGTDLEILDDTLSPVPVGEVGEICIGRGPGVFGGYYLDEENTNAALQGKWLRTGDLGKLDERGFVYIVGRTKEMYKSGGLQVFPNETENHLTNHEAVAEAYVVPFNDSQWGETGVAIVKLKDGREATEAELMDHLREYIAGYKRPKRIFIWDEIPKNAVGKVPKPMLREEIYSRGLANEGEDIQ